VSCNENALSIGRSQGFSHLSPVLWERGIAIDLKESSIDEHRIDWSNSVFINGQDIMEMLSERGDFFIFCRSCTDLTGNRRNVGPSSIRTRHMSPFLR